MAKETTSDKLKEIFAQNGGGSEKDWKRTDKRKDAEGHWVRTFRNAATGASVEVVELGENQFKARRLEAGDSTAADAAQKATAAKFVFAIAKDNGDMLDQPGYYAIISPKAYFEKTGYCYDQPSHQLDKILPDAEDVNECGTWVFETAKPDAKALAADLTARGFIWDRKFQDLIAPEVQADLAAPAPKAPAPKAP